MAVDRLGVRSYFHRIARTLRAAAAILLVSALQGLLPAGAPAARDGSVEPDIVGGTETTIGEWPWQVALAFRPGVVPGNGKDRQFCGGSLVAPTIVITAAHCLHDGIAAFRSPSLFSVITGRTSLSSGEGQEINFADLYYLTQGGFSSFSGAGVPLYQPAMDEDWDVAIVRLAAPANASTILVAGPDERAVWADGQPAFVTGWGDVFEGSQEGSDILREARVGILGDGLCGSANAYGSLFHADQMLCAGLERGGADTCQGDSGGPLVVPLSGGGFRLAGATSWGFGCARSGFPGVYSRIADSTLGPRVRSAILGIAGVDVYGSGARPLLAPSTVITRAPRKKRLKRGRTVRVVFEFTADEPTSSFLCEVDGGGVAPCTSPFEARLRKGRHTLTVTGVNFIGDGDATPATARVKVKKRRRR